MTFSPSIQSLVGAHSGGVSIGLDWVRKSAFELNNTYISRYGLITGLEEVYAPLADMGGVGENGIAAYIGVAKNGDVFISASGSLYNGAALLADKDTLAMINLIGYPAPNFGQGGMVGITYGSTQYCIDKGVGNNIIGVLNRVNYLSETTWLNEETYSFAGRAMCAGPTGTGTAYFLDNTGPIYLTKIQFDGSGFVGRTVIGSIAMSDIDAGWSSQFGINGVCLDQFDGKLLAFFQGVGGSNSHGALAKIDPTTAAVEWVRHVPNSDGGGPASTGNTFAYSNIKYQRIAFYTGSPPTVTVINTSDGSIADQYTTGLNGLSVIDGQCYNDSLGAIVLGCNFSQTAGSPTLLNSTPTSWSDGYAVLYVAAPPPAGRRFLSESGPIRPIPGPVGPTIGNDILTETGDDLITEDGDNLITET